jgi:hypothetical protein
VYLHSKWSMGPVAAVYQVREGSGGEPNPTLRQKAGPISPATEPQHLQGLSTGAVILVVKPERLQCHGFLWGLAASHGRLELSAPARSKNRRQNGQLHSSSTPRRESTKGKGLALGWRV